MEGRIAYYLTQLFCGRQQRHSWSNLRGDDWPARFVGDLWRHRAPTRASNWPNALMFCGNNAAAQRSAVDGRGIRNRFENYRVTLNMWIVIREDLSFLELLKLPAEYYIELSERIRASIRTLQPKTKDFAEMESDHMSLSGRIVYIPSQDSITAR